MTFVFPTGAGFAPIAIVASLPIVVVLRWLRHAGSAPVSNRTAACSVDRARPATNDVMAKPAAASSASNSVTPGSEDSDSIMVELLGPKWGSVAGAVLSVVGWVLGFFSSLGLVGWLGSFPLTGLLWISGETWSAAWERAKSEDMFGWALLCAIGTAAVLTSVSFCSIGHLSALEEAGSESLAFSRLRRRSSFSASGSSRAFFLWWFPFQTRDLAQARVDSTKNFSLKLVGMPLLNFRTVAASHDGRQRPGCVVFMGINDGLARPD